MRITVKSGSLTLLDIDVWSIILMIFFWNRKLGAGAAVENLKVFVDGKELPKPKAWNNEI